MQLMANSLVMGLVATAVALLAGAAAAAAVCGLPRRLRDWVSALFLGPLLLPAFVSLDAWLWWWGASGTFNGLTRSPAMAGVIVGCLYWPIAFILLVSAWGRLDQRQLDSDAALRGWPFIRWLLVPLAAGPLATAAIVTFVLGFNQFTVPALLQAPVLSVEV